MITSAQNAKIKWVRELQAQSQTRRDEQVFIVEGVRLVEEALKAGWPARLVLYCDELSPRASQLLAGFVQRQMPIEQVTTQVMRAASDTQTPQGILAVLEIPRAPLPGKMDFVIICDGLRDPGNLGSILRSAAAAGADAVLVTEGSVDIHAPKVVRSAMGAHFHIPTLSASWAEIRGLIQQQHLKVFLADAGGACPYTQANLRQPLVLVIGSEAVGAGEASSLLTDERLRIPMPGGLESLNAAAAAAVILFEIVRQRGP